MQIRRMVWKAWMGACRVARASWVAAAHGIAAGCWAAAIVWLAMPSVHGWAASEIASRSSGISFPAAWTLAGLGGIGLTLAFGLAFGAGAFMLATARERRARLWSTLSGVAVLLLVLPWGPLVELARPLALGHAPGRARIEALFPAGPFVVDTLAEVGWPLKRRARVTSGFGYRVHPVLGGRRFHNGIDIGVPEGTTVIAATSGRVSRAAEDELNGKYVVIHGPDGLRTAYCHLSALDVIVGQRVELGERIGRSGQTGRATGPHLHFGLWKHGRAVDPLRVSGPALAGP